MSGIAPRLEELCQRAAPARVIAVSKTQDIDVVREALNAGHRLFGENRVQEAFSKFPELRSIYSDIELHLIGPLQTNKALDAVALFDVIQTVDRPSLVDALVKAMEKTGHTPRFYSEVNIGHEPQKAGLLPECLPFFLRLCRNKGLEISGLMCIPPHHLDPRPFFLRMKALADLHSLTHLSMGMSADYKIAVECGATEVRIGSSLFGERQRFL